MHLHFSFNWRVYYVHAVGKKKAALANASYLPISEMNRSKSAAARAVYRMQHRDHSKHVQIGGTLLWAHSELEDDEEDSAESDMVTPKSSYIPDAYIPPPIDWETRAIIDYILWMLARIGEGMSVSLRSNVIASHDDHASESLLAQEERTQTSTYKPRGRSRYLGKAQNS